MSEQENTHFAQQAIAAINEWNLDRYLQLLDDSVDGAVGHPRG